MNLEKKDVKMICEPQTEIPIKTNLLVPSFRDFNIINNQIVSEEMRKNVRVLKKEKV